jgi:hypothetical protein
VIFTLSEAKSETDLWVCIVSNCSKHQSSSSNVAIACDNEVSSIIIQTQTFHLNKIKQNFYTWCCSYHFIKIRRSYLSISKLSCSLRSIYKLITNRNKFWKNIILPFRWYMSKINEIFPYIFKTSKKLSKWGDDHVILMPII